VKVKRHKPYGELMPLPVPEGKWLDISYDFITDLPKSAKGNSAILVVVDRFSKGAHFIPCTSKETAESTAQLFLENVWTLHGFPRTTVSDRGKEFNSNFMRRLYELLGIKPQFSTAYHPQTDGQTERINAWLEEFLRCYVDARQSNWEQLLPAAEFAYNQHQSASTGLSPFEVWYGEPLKFSPSIPHDSKIPAAESWAEQLHEVYEEVKASLKISQDNYTFQANKDRLPPPEFKVGDKVWLNRKNIKTQRPTSKLDYRRLGPFSIVEKINSNAYRLKLNPTMKIHDVFHVSLLEEFKEDTFGRKPQKLPPIIAEDGEEEYEVQEIMDSRIYKKRLQYLLRWKGYGPEDDEWVYAEDINGPEIINDFHKKHPTAVGKRRKEA
jgi:hypothetical protein